MICITLTSSVSTVILVNRLSIVKGTNKEIWAEEKLTYTFTLDNQITENSKTPVIIDVLDGTLVSFVADIVTIDGVKINMKIIKKIIL